MRWNRQSKYGNQKTTVDGITFDSRKEASYWQELKHRERAGEITEIVRQAKIELIPKTAKFRACYYIADFVYTDKKTGKTVYIDVKGMQTDVYKLKKKLLYWRHGIEITEV